MADPFISEIRMFSFPFAPKWWAQCNGQLLPIAQNQALFSLLGTTYGGNGTTNFALPDLRGRAPMSFGNGTVQGEAAGVETVTVLSSQLPMHTHQAVGATDAQSTSAYDGATFAAASNVPRPPTPPGPSNVYGPASALVPLGASMSAAGGSLPHNNMQPSLVVNFCIATVGVFPSRS